MFIVGNAVVDEAVSVTKFCCNLEACKGVCCFIEGGRGAPLEDEETEEIRKAYPIVRRYLRETSIRAIEATGLIEGRPGEYATPCIGERECVFAYFDGEIAGCSFERAYMNGEIGWRKPLSCHLFPLRVRRFGQDFVRYEEIEECSPGRDRGKADGIMLRDFLKDPLTRKFGAEWYSEFMEQCTSTGRM
jgi:Protein of unknown function (DUF3109)